MRNSDTVGVGVLRTKAAAVYCFQSSSSPWGLSVLRVFPPLFSLIALRRQTRHGESRWRNLLFTKRLLRCGSPMLEYRSRMRVHQSSSSSYAQPGMVSPGGGTYSFRRGSCGAGRQCWNTVVVCVYINHHHHHHHHKVSIRPAN